MRLKAIVISTLGGLLAGVLPLAAAQLGATAQAVMPSDTRQIISIDYHRLSQDPTAAQVESQVVPPEMRNLAELLKQGGVDARQDLNRIAFATYAAKGKIGLMGVAEGSFQNLKLARFFHPTKRNPHPPQYSGVAIYNAEGTWFFLPDQTTLVFGSRNAVETAIDAEQGVIPRIATNDQMSNLIAGTQTTDVWSVLDAAGTKNMVKSLVGGGKIDPALFAKRFDGARYTIAFNDQVQLNLEMMTSDALTAAALSAGLRAAVDYRLHQERDPNLKALLNQVQVDSAGDHAFLQVASPESSIATLLHSDLFNAVVR